MGGGKQKALRVDFDGQIWFEFHGAKITSDAGLLAYRELDEALGLTAETNRSSHWSEHATRSDRNAVTIRLQPI